MEAKLDKLLELKVQVRMCLIFAQAHPDADIDVLQKLIMEKVETCLANVNTN